MKLWQLYYKPYTYQVITAKLIFQVDEIKTMHNTTVLQKRAQSFKRHSNSNECPNLASFPGLPWFLFFGGR